MAYVFRFFSFMLLAAVLFFPATEALAQTGPPPPGDPKPFTLAAPETIELDNGLKVTLVEFGTVPKATISVVVKTGNLHEGEMTWLADLTADMLKEGTENRTAYDIVVEAAEMGGGVSINVGPDQTSLSTDVLAEDSENALALLADILRNPEFPESELPRIKQDYLRNLSVAKTQPRSLGQEALLGLLYPDHPYGYVFPEEDRLMGYTIGDIRTFYEQNFGAARTHIYVVGRFETDTMVRAIRRHFGDWSEGPAPFYEAPEPSRHLKVKLVDRPDSEQATIYLGLPVIPIADPDYIPFQIMHTMLGGSFSSRITQNIREEKGYTYSPRARISHRRGTAFWYQLADVTTDVTGPALSEIFSEIRRIQETVPPAEELDKVQNYRAGIFVLQNGSRSGIISQLSFLHLQGLDVEFLNNYVDEIFAVDENQIREIAQSQLPLSDMTLVVVGDMDVVEKQIRALPELEGAEFIQ